MSSLQIVMLGPPGSGKGTQSTRISEKYALEHITTGDALRARKDMETPHGTPREFMEAGELVPDPVVNEIVVKAIDDVDGFVLDGYPRNLEQAQFLDEQSTLDCVLYLEVSDEELVSRLTGRRVCPECGRNYHLEFAPPKTEGTCDECGAELIQREDDTEATVRNRLGVFEEQTAPVIEYYEERSSFVEIDGEQSPDDVWDEIDSVLSALVN